MKWLIVPPPGQEGKYVVEGDVIQFLGDRAEVFRNDAPSRRLIAIIPKDWLVVPAEGNEATVQTEKWPPDRCLGTNVTTNKRCVLAYGHEGHCHFG